MVKLFLVGDNNIPKDPDILLAAVETAYLEIANDCTALKLLTCNKGDELLRTGPGSTFVRMPSLPESDEDKLDIDSELVPAVGRIIAGYIAKDVNKKLYHKSEADRIIKRYESKVRTFMTAREKEGAYAD